MAAHTVAEALDEAVAGRCGDGVACADGAADAGHGSCHTRCASGDYPHHVRYFGNTDAIVGNAPNVIEHCRTLGWQGKTTIISNFPGEVGTSVVKRSDFSTPDDVPLVCGLGRFVPTKGFDTLLRAVAATPHLWLWLVGDGPDRADLERLVQELGIADRVRFIGWVSEPAAYIKAADMFCVPSRQEPLGNVLLEGWKAEVAVVSTKTEGPSWAAAHDESALFTEIDDVEAWRRRSCVWKGRPSFERSWFKVGESNWPHAFPQSGSSINISNFSRNCAAAGGERPRAVQLTPR